MTDQMSQEQILEVLALPRMRDAADAASLVIRGGLLAQLDRLEEAETDLRAALALEERADTLMSLASILLMVENYIEAEMHMRRALYLEPTAERWMFLGDLCFGREDQTAGIQAYDAALALNPADPDMLCRHVQMLLSVNRLPQAAEGLERLAALEGETHRVRLYRGLCLYHRRRYAEALTEFDAAVALNPDDVRTRIQRSRVYHKMRRFEDGLADLDRAVALEPKNAMAYRNRMRMLSELTEAARMRLEKSVAEDYERRELEDAQALIVLEMFGH